MKLTRNLGGLLQAISGSLVGLKIAAAGSGAVAGALANSGIAPPGWLVAITTITGMIAGVQAFNVNPDGTNAKTAYKPTGAQPPVNPK